MMSYTSTRHPKCQFLSYYIPSFHKQFLGSLRFEVEAAQLVENIGVGTGGDTGGMCPPSFINCYINCSLLYV